MHKAECGMHSLWLANHSRIWHESIMFSVYFLLHSSQACLPYLKQSKNPHILNISPPLNMKPIWFKNHTGERFFLSFFSSRHKLTSLGRHFNVNGRQITSKRKVCRLVFACIRFKNSGTAGVKRVNSFKVLKSHYFICILYNN